MIGPGVHGRRLAFAVWLLVLAFAFAPRAAAADSDDWSPLMVVRFGNIDAIDAEDGELAAFLRSIRNDGRFTPPMRDIVGPEIRNPTFFGIAYEAWMECVLLVPVSAGNAERLWVFPVENRDEYMTQLAGLGLSEYEGMDGVTILREMDADGNIHTWHMEWLPGNVAVFGANRDAVASARQLYAENSASRGLLARAGAGFMEPDVLVRLFPPLLASWQDREPGLYWWRDKIDRLANDLIAYWQPSPARARLVRSFADLLVLWPRGVRRLDFGLWLESAGLEWNMAVDGDYHARPPSQLAVIRRVPDRTALAWAVPTPRETVEDFGRYAGDFILAAAGGVVSQEARQEAKGFFELLLAGGMGEAAFAWVPPPAGNPELGGCRLLLAQWENPDAVDAAWERLRLLAGPGAAAAQVFSQMGWKVELLADPADPRAADLFIYPANDSGNGVRGEPYCHATATLRRNGGLAALVVGESRPDAAIRAHVAAYRARLAEEAVNSGGAGGADVREAFTKAGPAGASFLGFFEPVRFLQLCLIESGDWRPRSPDQHEPLSTQLAREMLEYSSGRAWTAAGESSPGTRRLTGSVGWDSLARLAAALGLTEAIAME